MAGHNSRYKTLLNSSDFPSVVRRLHFTGSKLTIICSLMTTLKTCIRTITYLSDIGCLEIQGASLGAMVVFSEGASASALGVATFQTALISALLLSGLLCDRFGIGVDEKKYFTPYRIIGALFAVIATIFVVSPQWHSTSFILLAILPFLAGLLAGWQPAGNAKVAEATGSMLVSIT